MALAPLTGKSDKQIAYGEDKRATFIAEADMRKRELMRLNAKAPAAQKEAFAATWDAEIAGLLARETTARHWIDGCPVTILKAVQASAAKSAMRAK